jgi:glycosyltransferase involved in cell wall biosynthesis
MKLLVCSNFAQPFHTGGAERVVQQITESLSLDSNFSCSIFCQHGKGDVIFNNVKISPVGHLKENEFIQKILNENPDHLFVYSDWFFMWPAILHNSHQLSMNKSIALVGMNRMRSSLPANKIVADVFINKKSEFRVITHAHNYIDNIICKNLNIDTRVIHNAVNLNEFNKSDFDFKKHYGIKTDKMILCVSNFFPGKGQEFMIPIISKLFAKRKDITWVFISSTLAFEPGNRLRNIIKHNCEKMNLPVRFLNDIPRSHVVQSYFSCDLFVFPSQQECGPIVLLESMAAQKPWISMNVGHVSDLQGGFCIDSLVMPNGMNKFDNNVANSFLLHIENLLSDQNLCNNLGEAGRLQVEKEYNWINIQKEYEIFFREGYDG